MTKNHINIEKIDQQYLYDVIRLHPNISSGRKNYSTQYKRVLKNILLSKIYAENKALNNKNLYRPKLIK